MASNNFASNFTNKLMRVFLEKFEAKRSLSKNVNTQKLSDAFDASTGDTVYFKRPTDFTSSRTSDGDISGTTSKGILTGKASGVVQNYITVEVDYTEADQAIKMDQLDELLAPMATRIVTDLEVDFAAFMMKNSGLLAGTFGTAVTTWADVAAAAAVMKATGIPEDQPWHYALNPYTDVAIAATQVALGAGGQAGMLTKSAHDTGMMARTFAGLNIECSTALASFTMPATGDLVGAINGTPDVSYATAKDTMTQSIIVDAFGSFTGTIPAGAVVKITGANRLNLSTRQPILDAAGANVLFTGTLSADASLTSGAGTLVVTGPALFESTSGALGSYNTTEAAIADNDVITILGADSTAYQPNLFWHQNAFAIGSVPIAKLHSTDTRATTEDGLQLRVSLGSSFRENKQQVRIDLRPAYAVLNPHFAGQGWG